jgi:phosphoglycolate phosphatase/pyrophosphatase PpaX
MESKERNRGPVVLFDLDGTLINTKRLYLEAYRRAVLPYIGRELSHEEILALRPRCELRFLRDVVGADRLQPCLADFHREYDALHPQFFGGTYAGITELLTALRQALIPLGIVTGKSRRSWEITTPHAPLGSFDALVFADDVTEPKPDPEGLLLALAQLAADPAQTFYLGDSVSDMEAARAAGTIPAAAVWAKKPEDRNDFVAQLEPLGIRIFAKPDEFAREVLRSSKSG